MAKQSFEALGLAVDRFHKSFLRIGTNEDYLAKLRSGILITYFLERLLINFDRS